MGRFCKKCGAQIPEGAAFCPKCGTAASGAGQASDPGRDKAACCPRCGSKLSPGAAFCAVCGQRLGPEASPRPAAQAPSGGRVPAGERPASGAKPAKRALCWLLVAALLLGLGYGGFVKPGFLKDKLKPNVTRQDPSPSLRPTLAPTPDRSPAPTTAPSPAPSPAPSAEPEPSPAPSPAPSAEPEPSPAPTPIPTPGPAPLPEDDGEEHFSFSDAYRTGTPGLDFALGQGPGSDGYQEMDGYGVETLIAYSRAEIDATPFQTAPVHRGTSEVSLGGVTILFGGNRLKNEEDTLRLRVLPQRTDELNGYRVSAWELSFEGQAELPGLVEVTVPCAAKEETEVIAQQYDAALGRWTYVDYEVDPDASTVTLTLDGAAPFGVFTLVSNEPSPWERPVGASEAGEAGGKVLSAKESQALKFSLDPRKIQKAAKGNADIEEQVWHHSAEIREKIAQGRAAELYARDQILRFVSDKTGDAIDGASLGCSLAEYACALPPYLSTALSGISLALTAYQTSEKAVKAYLESGYLKAGAAVMTKAVDLAYGTAALYSTIATYYGAAPTVFVLKPEVLIVVGACLLACHLISDGMEYEELSNAHEPPLQAVYRQAPYHNIYWDEAKKELTWFPDMGLWLDLGRTIAYAEVDPSLYGWNITKERYLRQHVNDGYEGILYVFTELPIPGRLKENRYDLERRIPLNAEYFELYDLFRAKYDSMWVKDKGDAGTSYRYRVEDFVSIGIGADSEGYHWEGGWPLILEHIKEEYEGKPEEWYPALDRYLKRIEEMSMDYAFDVAELTGLPPASPDISADQFIADMVYRFIGPNARDCFQSFFSSCLKEAKKINLGKLAAFRKLVNREIRFRLVDQNGQPITFEDTEYAGKYIVFRTAPGLYTLSSPWVAEMRDSIFLRCTYTGYMQAGYPEWLDVYESVEAWRQGRAPITEIELKEVGETEVTHTLPIPIKESLDTAGEYPLLSVTGGEYLSLLREIVQKAPEQSALVLLEDGRFSAVLDTTGELPQQGPFSFIFTATNIVYDVTYTVKGQKQPGAWAGSAEIEGNVTLEITYADETVGNVVIPLKGSTEQIEYVEAANILRMTFEFPATYKKRGVIEEDGYVRSGDFYEDTTNVRLVFEWTLSE